MSEEGARQLSEYLNRTDDELAAVVEMRRKQEAAQKAEAKTYWGELAERWESWRN